MNRRQFLGAASAAAVTLAMPFSASARFPDSGPPRLLPRPLNPGDTVALVSPSSATLNPVDFAVTQKLLQQLGLRVKPGANLRARRGHLAGTDAQRASDLNAAFADESISAVICARGGAGAARLLPMLDYDMIRHNPKVLLGYSDITALHNALTARIGLVSFHGPNGSDSWNPFNAAQFRRMFFDRELIDYGVGEESDDGKSVRRNRPVTITPGVVQGELVGGNLAVLSALAGSAFFPDMRGKILFLEDVSEELYRFDRMMSTLKLNGTLDQIAGFIFGKCTDCGPAAGSLPLAQILDDHIKPLGIPAFRGALIGHIRQQFILPVGGTVEMDAGAGTFRMLESVFAD